jgi:hypothetical protein
LNAFARQEELKEGDIPKHELGFVCCWDGSIIVHPAEIFVHDVFPDFPYKILDIIRYLLGQKVCFEVIFDMLLGNLPGLGSFHEDVIFAAFHESGHVHQIFLIGKWFLAGIPTVQVAQQLKPGNHHQRKNDGGPVKGYLIWHLDLTYARARFSGLVASDFKLCIYDDNLKLSMIDRRSRIGVCGPLRVRRADRFRLLLVRRNKTSVKYLRHYFLPVHPLADQVIIGLEQHVALHLNFTKFQKSAY